MTAVTVLRSSLTPSNSSSLGMAGDRMHFLVSFLDSLKDLHDRHVLFHKCQVAKDEQVDEQPLDECNQSRVSHHYLARGARTV